ncbi:hypothetical protein G7046_g4546 [Stylonectria norvegica]|nr:hypothetical protein G7046_g4546 [Stylonectria norvegica]
MFYSNEILNNSQYGVSTIWLVATGTNQKRINRKAIQDVNVPKACETIIDPGAPLALRLQGNLLYGVSRVFAQQCTYVLSDASKTQSDMMTFFRIMKQSDVDPQAGKAKRHQITLQDDPNFDPLSIIIPNFDLFELFDKDLHFLPPSQDSTQRMSQMTPLGGPSQASSSSGQNPSLFGFNLPASSRSAGSYRLPSDLGHDGSPLANEFKPLDLMAEFNPFGEEDIGDFDGIGLNFDADGNLILNEPEPELPPHPGSEARDAQLLGQDINMTGVDGAQVLDPVGGGNEVVFSEDALPDAEAFPKRAGVKRRLDTSSTQTSETLESETATAHAQRGRPRKVHSMLDQKLNIPRPEFNSWVPNYLDNMDAARKKPRTTNQAQARKNALEFIYGCGIADVGLAIKTMGVAHPLAVDFSGATLMTRLQGRHPEEEDDKEEAAQRGRRRSSSEAFEDEKEEQRRVRQKADEPSELARGFGDDLEQLMLADETAPEIGMEAVPGMEDHHSSSMMPWSRPPSVVPGSSIRGHGSAQKGMPAPSPLLGRGSVVRSIERHSDLPGLPQDSDDFAQLYSQDSSLDLGGPVGGFDLAAGNDTQASNAGLDIASQEFLGYATALARDKGHARLHGGKPRRWINFEELADPATHDKGVAAQAFLHVLSLATKNAVAVEQEGIEKQQPFGAIRIGLKVTQHDDMEDELA